MTREILLIDDDEDELDLFTEALHSIDKTISCTQAKDLNEALAFFESSLPAYIFIDFNMPKVDGLQCLAEIRKIAKLGGSKIILYSNHIDAEMEAKAQALGAFRSLKKPYMINLLARRLKEILAAG
jgi:DNA-binding NtrC family response regulator